MPKLSPEEQIRKNYIAWCEEKIKPEDIAILKSEIKIKGEISAEGMQILERIKQTLGGMHTLSYVDAIVQSFNPVIAEALEDESELAEELEIDPKELEGILEEEPPIPDLKKAEKEKKAFDKENEKKKFRKISRMSVVNFLNKETMGRISPPLNDNFIVELNLPHSRGYVHLTPTEEQIDANAQEVPFKDNEAYKAKPDDTEVEISLPSDEGTPVPVPLDYKMVACLDEYGYQIAPPFSESPLLHINADEIEDAEAHYFLRKVDKKNKIDANPIKPTQVEQDYWRKVAPLPEAFYKLDKSNPEVIAKAVTAYMRRHFKYALNDQLGDFIEANLDDLPLIINTLKVGHCSYLAWMHSVFLRSLGVSAFTTNELCPSRSGTSFLRKSGHSRSGYVDSNGNVRIEDPAQAFIAREFDPNVTSSVDFEDLEADYSAAETEAQKIEALKKFKKKLMENLAQNPKIEFKIDYDVQPFRFESREDVIPINSAFYSSGLGLRSPELSDEEIPWTEFLEHATKALLYYFGEKGEPIGDECVSDVQAYIARIVDKRYDASVYIGGNEKSDVHKLFKMSMKRGQFPVTLFNFDTCFFNNDEFILFDDLFNYHTSFGLKFDENMKQAYESASTASELLHWLIFEYKTPVGDSMFRDKTINESAIAEETYDQLRRDAISNNKNFMAISRLVISPNISFEPDFVEYVKMIIQDDKFPEALYRKFKKPDNIWRHPNLLIHYWQISILYQLMGRALLDSKVAKRLKEEFGINKKALKSFAQKVQPVDKGKPRRVSTNIASLKSKSSGEVDFKKLYKILKIPGKQAIKARKNVRNLIKQLDKSKRRGQGSPRPENYDIREYQPGDDPRYIHASTYARTGVPHVKVPEKAKAYSDPIHVIIDNHLHGTHDVYLFSTLEILISELLKIAKQGEGRDIYITNEQGEVYLKLRPGDKKHNPRQLAHLLLYTHENFEDYDEFTRNKVREEVVPNGSSFGFHTKNGLPKNILYLTNSEGKIAAVKHQVGHRSNLVAVTFEDADLFVFNEVRDEWVDEEEIDENGIIVGE